jgi:Flp pilus assembly pilin Flp
MVRKSLQRILLTLRGEKGQGLVEYSLITLLVAVMVMGAINVLGGGVAEWFEVVTDQFP